MEITLTLTEEQVRYVRAAIVRRNLETWSRYCRCRDSGDTLSATKFYHERNSGREVVDMIDSFLFGM